MAPRSRRSKAQAAAKSPPNAARTHVPHPNDLRNVRRAFEEDAKHPERRLTLTPEQIRHLAETGEWPESFD